MHSNHTIMLYRILSNDIIIRIIDIHPAIIGVNLDAAKFSMLKGFLYLCTCAFSGIPYIHICKTVKPAILFANAKHIPMDGVNCKFHGHQPGIVKRHNHSILNIESIHELPVTGSSSKGKFII